MCMDDPTMALRASCISALAVQGLLSQLVHPIAGRQTVRSFLRLLFPSITSFFRTTIRSPYGSLAIATHQVPWRDVDEPSARRTARQSDKARPSCSRQRTCSTLEPFLLLEDPRHTPDPTWDYSLRGDPLVHRVTSITCTRILARMSMLRKWASASRHSSKSWTLLPEDGGS
jgi:hypothetical protein